MSSSPLSPYILQYLDRINFPKEEIPNLSPSLSTLQRLMHCHILSIPFSNSYLHSDTDTPTIEPTTINCGFNDTQGKVPSVDDIKLIMPLFNHIVTKRKGGVCTDLNPLFGWLLNALGYTVSICECQVFNPEGSLCPIGNHVILFVKLGVEDDKQTVRVINRDREEVYIVDVGFPSASGSPLLFDPLAKVTDYRIPPFSIDTERTVRIIALEGQINRYHLQWKIDNPSQVVGMWPIPNNSSFPLYQSRIEFSYARTFTSSSYKAIYDWVRSDNAPFIKGLFFYKLTKDQSFLCVSTGTLKDKQVTGRVVINKASAKSAKASSETEPEDTKSVKELKSRDEILSQLTELEK